MKRVWDIKDVDLTALQHFFQDACSDEEFKNYVYNLGIKEDILMKYTSNLKDSFEEFKNCQNCLGLDKCKNKVPGYLYAPQKEKDIIVFSYDCCSKMQEFLETNYYKDNLEIFQMPEEIKNANFKNIYKDDKMRVPIIKYFKEFIDKFIKGEKPKGIYLSGSFGSGKTYLIAALFNEMAKKNIRSALVYYPEFLRSLKAGFNDNSYNDKFLFIKKVPLLLLDDIGAENESNWSRDEILGPILQYRMDNNLATFFTSNLTLEELEKVLAITSSGIDKVKARRIIERIKYLTIELSLISKNRRS